MFPTDEEFLLQNLPPQGDGVGVPLESFFASDVVLPGVPGPSYFTADNLGQEELFRKTLEDLKVETEDDEIGEKRSYTISASLFAAESQIPSNINSILVDCEVEPPIETHACDEKQNGGDIEDNYTDFFSSGFGSLSDLFPTQNSEEKNKDDMKDPDRLLDEIFNEMADIPKNEKCLKNENELVKGKSTANGNSIVLPVVTTEPIAIPAKRFGSNAIFKAVPAYERFKDDLIADFGFECKPGNATDKTRSMVEKQKSNIYHTKKSGITDEELCQDNSGQLGLTVGAQMVLCSVNEENTCSRSGGMTAQWLGSKARGPSPAKSTFTCQLPIITDKQSSKIYPQSTSFFVSSTKAVNSLDEKMNSSSQIEYLQNHVDGLSSTHLTSALHKGNRSHQSSIISNATTHCFTSVSTSCVQTRDSHNNSSLLNPLLILNSITGQSSVDTAHSTSNLSSMSSATVPIQLPPSSTMTSGEIEKSSDIVKMENSNNRIQAKKGLVPIRPKLAENTELKRKIPALSAPLSTTSPCSQMQSILMRQNPVNTFRRNMYTSSSVIPLPSDGMQARMNTQMANNKYIASCSQNPGSCNKMEERNIMGTTLEERNVRQDSRGLNHLQPQTMLTVLPDQVPVLTSTAAVNQAKVGGTRTVTAVVYSKRVSSAEKHEVGEIRASNSGTSAITLPRKSATMSQPDEVFYWTGQPDVSLNMLTPGYVHCSSGIKGLNECSKCCNKPKKNVSTSGEVGKEYNSFGLAENSVVSQLCEDCGQGFLSESVSAAPPEVDDADKLDEPEKPKKIVVNLNGKKHRCWRCKTCTSSAWYSHRTRKDTELCGRCYNFYKKTSRGREKDNTFSSKDSRGRRPRGRETALRRDETDISFRPKDEKDRIEVTMDPTEKGKILDIITIDDSTDEEEQSGKVSNQKNVHQTMCKNSTIELNSKDTIINTNLVLDCAEVTSAMETNANSKTCQQMEWESKNCMNYSSTAATEINSIGPTSRNKTATTIIHPSQESLSMTTPMLVHCETIDPAIATHDFNNNAANLMHSFDTIAIGSGVFESEKNVLDNITNDMANLCDIPDTKLFDSLISWLGEDVPVKNLQAETEERCISGKGIDMCHQEKDFDFNLMEYDIPSGEEGVKGDKRKNIGRDDGYSTPKRSRKISTTISTPRITDTTESCEKSSGSKDDPDSVPDIIQL